MTWKMHEKERYTEQFVINSANGVLRIINQYQMHAFSIKNNHMKKYEKADQHVCSSLWWSVQNFVQKWVEKK